MSNDVDETKMPLLDHLVELRRRLIYSVLSFFVCFVACFYFADPIFNFLVEPLAELWAGQQSRRLIFTALHEKFFTDVKVAFFAGAFISFPLISNQIWLFVAPGLYKNEKRAFLPFLAATPVLFLIGAAFVYYLVLPVAWKFFAGFEQAAAPGLLAIELEPKVDQYLALVMQLIFAFGISFELPVLLTLLVRAGLTSSETLRKNRRYAIVIAFVAAAVLTPPDPLSQIGLAVPIILLYEISIWCGRLIERGREKREREDDI
jgi:sec-independent protein translocase protein TatC